MSEKERANITLPEALKEQANEGGNLSATIETALHEYFEEATIHYVNTNAQYVPKDGCAIYENGVVATYGDKDPFGNYLKLISPGDGVVSYVSMEKSRIRAVLGRLGSHWLHGTARAFPDRIRCMIKITPSITCR
jgi:hypothetical protein